MVAEDERAAIVTRLREYRTRLIASERRALKGAKFDIKQGAQLRDSLKRIA